MCQITELSYKMQTILNLVTLAPRRPAPSRSRADAAAAAGRRQRRRETADGWEKSAHWEHRPRVSEQCGPGGAIAAREYPGTESPPFRRSGSARTRCWGAESRLSSSFTGKAGEFELPRPGGCSRRAAEDRDRPLEGKTLRSGRAYVEPDRSLAASGLNLGWLIEL